MKKPTPPKPNPSAAGFQPATMKMKNPRTTEPEPPCCSNPTPLIPIVIIGALFILAVVLGMILFQQEKIATQRQQLSDCTNHVQGLQTALLEAKWQRDTWSTLANRLAEQRGREEKWVWLVGGPYSFTNTPLYYPKFLLKD